MGGRRQHRKKLEAEIFLHMRRHPFFPLAPNSRRIYIKRYHSREKPPKCTIMRDMLYLVEYGTGVEGVMAR